MLWPVKYLAHNLTEGICGGALGLYSVNLATWLCRERLADPEVATGIQIDSIKLGNLAAMGGFHKCDKG